MCVVRISSTSWMCACLKAQQSDFKWNQIFCYCQLYN